MTKHIDFMRQTDIFDPKNQKTKIKIIGAGSTGSLLTLMLAKTGFNDIEIWDFDKIEVHNIPNQFFKSSQIGKPKVEALKENIREFSGLEIQAHNQKVGKETDLPIDLDAVYVFCVDNLEVRKEIYENKLKGFAMTLIDTRMGGEEYNLQVINLNNPQDQKRYEKSLNIKPTNLPCGSRSIIYAISSLAVETCNILKRIDSGQPFPKKLNRHMGRWIIVSGE